MFIQQRVQTYSVEFVVCCQGVGGKEDEHLGTHAPSRASRGWADDRS